MIASALIEDQDRWRRPGRGAAAILAAALSFASISDVGASDGNFQSVLLEAGCPTARIDKLSDRNGTATYRANCFSTSHKIIIVTCLKGVCAAGHPVYDERQERG